MEKQKSFYIHNTCTLMHLHALRSVPFDHVAIDHSLRCLEFFHWTKSDIFILNQPIDDVIN